MSHKELQLWTRCGQAQVTLALRQLDDARLGAAPFTPWSLGARGQLPGGHLSLSVREVRLKALNDDDDSLNHKEEEHHHQVLAESTCARCWSSRAFEEPTASELADLPYVTEDVHPGSCARCSRQGSDAGCGHRTHAAGRSGLRRHATPQESPGGRGGEDPQIHGGRLSVAMASPPPPLPSPSAGEAELRGEAPALVAAKGNRCLRPERLVATPSCSPNLFGVPSPLC